MSLYFEGKVMGAFAEEITCILRISRVSGHCYVTIICSFVLKAETEEGWSTDVYVSQNKIHNK